MFITKIAARNLARNKRRTIITTGAMAFALAIMIVYSGLTEGFIVIFEENAVGMDMSKIQIHAKGYRDEPSIYTWIDSSDSLIKQIEDAGYQASPRQYGFALAAGDMTSAGVQLRGVDIKRESTVTALYKHVHKGTWLTISDPAGVVIGKKLAKTLNVDIGDEIVILGQAADGSMANDLYRVKGIFKTVSETIDRAGFFMSIDAYRELMGYSGGAHQIAVRPPDKMTLDQAVEQLRTMAPEAEVLDWRKLIPTLAQLLDSVDVMMYLLYIIAYAAIGMVTLNAMLMAVFERIREIGIMKAIGISPWQVGGMILIETLIQTLLATMIAVAVSVPLSLYLETNGINLSSLGSGLSMNGVAMDPIWKTCTTARTIFMPIIFMVCMVAVAVIYPGIKAALVRPIKAIYHR